MKPIAIFYHSLFFTGNPPTFSENAFNVVSGQMDMLRTSGLLEHASHFVVGINGGEESQGFADLAIPYTAKRVMHGLDSKAENLTIIEIEKWVPTHPDWNVLYFHAKGATHEPTSDYGKFCVRWRNCMMKHCVQRWPIAIQALEDNDAAGCHWMTGMGSTKDQHFFAGTFFWATSNFLAKVPSMYNRERIKQSGIASIESRYEAEVWIGNGPMPKVKDLETSHGLAQCP